MRGAQGGGFFDQAQRERERVGRAAARFFINLSPRLAWIFLSLFQTLKDNGEGLLLQCNPTRGVWRCWMDHCDGLRVCL
jgi:hypothetical protein